MIIGLVGGYCAGRDTVADYLMDQGFIHYSLTDAIREEARARNILLTLENLDQLGEELRDHYGNSVLASRILSKIKEGRDYVISGLTHTGEINLLKNHEDFVLIKIDAPVKLRYDRMRERNRDGDPTSFDDFKEQEKENKEIKLGKLSSVVLTNESDLSNLYTKVDMMLDDLRLNLLKKQRPGKDSYYMNIAKEASSRATCLSTKVGAVIVKDEQIIATGFNGAPRHTMDCLERGECLRRKMNIPSGQRYEMCRSVHAEQNVIINAARAGVSLLGGIMYIYGKRVYKGHQVLVNAFPCFICKKMIINAGIKKVISVTENGDFRVFDVEKEWVKDWQNNDMLESQEMTDYE